MSSKWKCFVEFTKYTPVLVLSFITTDVLPQHFSACQSQKYNLESWTYLHPGKSSIYRHHLQKGSFGSNPLPKKEICLSTRKSRVRRRSSAAGSVRKVAQFMQVHPQHSKQQKPKLMEIRLQMKKGNSFLSCLFSLSHINKSNHKSFSSVTIYCVMELGYNASKELKGSIITFDVIFLEANVTKINSFTNPGILIFSHLLFPGEKVSMSFVLLKAWFYIPLKTLIMNFAS